ncbi:phytase [bacterium]|nr:phytase [bacterium]
MSPFRFLKSALAGAAALTVLGPAVDPVLAVDVDPILMLADPSANDQDDLCIWVHPTDPWQSTIIASDKFADRILVYGLQGDLLQALDINADPGNIDLRKGFPFGGEQIDIAVVNNRSKDKLFVYRVDQALGTLTRIDDNDLDCSDSYGLCLYHNQQTGTFYAFTTDKNGNIRQFELYDSGSGLAIDLVRSWSYGDITEGCVADDQAGFVYFAEEQVAIWKVGAEPDDPTPGEKIARVGDDGLAADIEGLTLYKGPRNSGYLIASSQGNNSFKVYERHAPHDLVETVTVDGVTGSDGIDLASGNLGPDFNSGIFACHSNSGNPKPIAVCALEDLELTLDPGSPDHGSVPPDSAATGVPEGAAVSPFAPRISGQPNPFRGSTRLHFQLARDNAVSLSIVDTSGRVVARLLHDRAIAAGDHTLDWNGTDDAGRAVPAGVYFYRLRSDDGTATGKTTLLR